MVALRASFCSQSSSKAFLVLTRLPAMAFRALFVFLSIAGAFSEDVASALASDDVCEGQDCSLELHQLRGMKVNYLEALEDASDDEEEEAVQVEEEAEEEAEVEGGGCTDAADMKTWKSGGKRSFDAALNSCGRGCAAGFPCTKDMPFVPMPSHTIYR